MSFTDITPDELINVLKNAHPDGYPLNDYHYIYALCCGNDRKLSKELVKTFFEFYNHNPIDINKIMPPLILISQLKDTDIIIYIIELCTYSNYAPVNFTSINGLYTSDTNDLLRRVCFGKMFDLLKYIVDLPSKFPQYYGNILKDINFNDLIIVALLCSSSYESEYIGRAMAHFLYKTAVKNKFTIDYKILNKFDNIYDYEENIVSFHQYGIVCFNDKIKL
jgi:hypothetical protein